METTRIKCFGAYSDLAISKAMYGDGTLAIRVWEVTEEGYVDPFGTLTVNLGDPRQGNNRAFVKDYSENEEWARELIQKTGIAKPVEDAYAFAGYAPVQLFEFDMKRIEEIEIKDPEL